MVCKKCNFKNSENKQFCEKCGCELNKRKTLKVRKIAVIAFVFSFNFTLIAFIMSIIGLGKSFKAKDKVAIVLNIIALIMALVISVLLSIKLIEFFRSFNNLLN